MECTVRYKEQIQAYKWDGNEERVKIFLNDWFIKVEENKLYVNTVFINTHPIFNEYSPAYNEDPFKDVFEDVTVILDIGDWIILTMNEYDQMPFKCTPKEFREKFYII